MIREKSRWLLVGGLLASTLIGCQNMNHTQRGAAMGTGLGALAGTIVGHQSGKKAEGALIGAAAGALGGGLLGNAQDNQEKADSWASYAHHQDVQHQRQQAAVGAKDIVSMSDSGLQEEHIITAIHNRGVNFDPNPEHLMYLKQSGVSDNVISSIQTHTRR